MSYYCYMKVIRSQRELLLQNRMLSSRQAILDHCIEEVIKEVYENTAQLLSLARIQLLQPGAPQDQKSGELIGQAIRDLRRHCQQLQWPLAVQEAQGFRDLLQQELHRYFPAACFQEHPAQSTHRKGSKELRLFLFSILLKIFRQLHRTRKNAIDSLLMEEDNAGIHVQVLYKGKPLHWEHLSASSPLPGLIKQAGGLWQQEPIGPENNQLLIHLNYNRFV